jgi:hypothetical protein
VYKKNLNALGVEEQKNNFSCADQESLKKFFTVLQRLYALLRLMDIRRSSFRRLCLFSDSNLGVDRQNIFRNGMIHFSTLHVSSLFLLGRVAV